MASGSQQIVIFYVFIAFFALIGIASLAALLGLVPSADQSFRKWAVPGFGGAVVVAVVGVYKALTIPPFVPIVVTLLAPAGALPPPLKSGAFQYDEVAQDTGKVMTHRGSVVPVLGEANWQVQLPGEVSNKAIQLLLEDENGNWWRTERFYANYVKQELRVGKKPELVGSATWQMPGVAVVAAIGAASLGGGQEQATVKFNNYARRNGTELQQRANYDWRVFVDEPAAVLEAISQVDYVLHPTFPEPFQSSRDRSKQFEVRGSGWGGFTIIITVHYTSGREVKASYVLDLNKDWPSQTANANLSGRESQSVSIPMERGIQQDFDNWRDYASSASSSFRRQWRPALGEEIRSVEPGTCNLSSRTQDVAHGTCAFLVVKQANANDTLSETLTLKWTYSEAYNQPLTFEKTSSGWWKWTPETPTANLKDRQEREQNQQQIREAFKGWMSELTSRDVARMKRAAPAAKISPDGTSKATCQVLLSLPTSKGACEIYWRPTDPITPPPGMNKERQKLFLELYRNGAVYHQDLLLEQTQSGRWVVKPTAAPSRNIGH
jgi:hypothetical protein